MMSTALERTSWSTTSRAISPLSGWHRIILSTSRPILCRAHSEQLHHQVIERAKQR